MVECVVKNWQGEEVGQKTFDLRVAKQETASHVVHRALVRQMTNARQGTASVQKPVPKSEVGVANLGGKKVLVVRVQDLFVHRSGVAVESSLDQSLENTT